MIEYAKGTWISRILRWFRPKDGVSILAWKRARRALRSQPRRRVTKVKLWNEV